MDWHHSWTSCKWRGSNKEVVAGQITPVGLLQLAARQPLSACRFPAKHSKHRIAVPNKDKMHLLSWPAHPGQCAGYVKLYNVMTWRMLGGGSAAGPLHPNLTACMHAHPALLSPATLQNPRPQTGLPGHGLWVDGPKHFTPGGPSFHRDLRLLPPFLLTNLSARTLQVFSGLCSPVAVVKLPHEKL